MPGASRERLIKPASLVVDKCARVPGLAADRVQRRMPSGDEFAQPRTAGDLGWSHRADQPIIGM
jgi:hypothetical protein